MFILLYFIIPPASPIHFPFGSYMGQPIRHLHICLCSLHIRIDRYLTSDGKRENEDPGSL